MARWLVCSGLVVVLGLALAAAGQEPLATVEGKVTLEGEPLEGAKVLLKKVDSTEGCEVKTNAEGEYSCRLPEGRYHLAVIVAGRYLGPQEVEVSGRLGNRFDIQLTQEHLRRAQRDPQALQADLNRAVALMKEGKFEEALPILEQLVEEIPEQWVVQAQLAVAYDNLRRLEEAATHYEKAIELRPDHAPLHMNLGGVYAGLGRMKDARKHYEAVAELDPPSAAQAYFNLGIALYNKGQTKEALEPFRKVTQLQPDRAAPHYFLGVCLFSNAETKVESGEVKMTLLPGTRESFERYLELEPDGPHAEDARAMLQALETTVPAETKAEQK